MSETLRESSRKALEEWRPPSDFLARVTAMFSQTAHNYRANEHKWLREAWVLARAAVAIDCNAVRLPSIDPPDGELCIGNSCCPVEIVEVLDPDRRPEGDLKSGVDRSTHTPGEWDAEGAEVHDALLKALAAKRKKKYAAATVLLIYLNIDHHARKPDAETTAAIQYIARSDTEGFTAVCILWRDTLYGPAHLLPGGKKTLPFEVLDY